MKKTFICSIICDGGILGGALYLNSNSLTYKTNKLTVDAKYRNLVLPISEIKEITWKKVIFPIATVHMKHGVNYKFLIFSTTQFEKYFKEIFDNRNI